ncbi:MAG: hypothetical protein HYY76_05900 [Acidobacteria bacterium]|nr:hypothetical protein [Acidobacteriota bacterium]
MKQLPVVCTLTPETMATRKAQLLPGVFRRAQAVEPMPEGYCLQLDSSGGHVAGSQRGDRGRAALLPFSAIPAGCRAR